MATQSDNAKQPEDTGEPTPITTSAETRDITVTTSQIRATGMEGDRAEQSGDTGGPTLLTIPPEMRNRIYREVLLDNPIMITSSKAPPPEPGLLGTCRQARAEARAIYYKENQFNVYIEDFNLARLKEWQYRSPLHKQLEFGIFISECHNWSLLLDWVELFYRQEVPGIAFAEGDEGGKWIDSGKQQNFSDLVAAVFNVAYRLREAKVPWSSAVALLGDVRRAFAALDDRWGKSE